MADSKSLPVNPSVPTKPIPTATQGTTNNPGPINEQNKDITKEKDAAPQNVPTKATDLAAQPTPQNQPAATKAAEAAQREQSVKSPVPPPKSPSQASAEVNAKSGIEQGLKEQARVEAGKPMASGATDVKQNREETTKPTQIPDIKKPQNDQLKPTMDSAPSRGGPAIIAKPERATLPGPDKNVVKIQNETKLPDNHVPILQDAKEIASSSPIKGGSKMHDTNVPFNEKGATGPSGIPGTGDNGLTAGGNTPQAVNKSIVFTVLLADSKLHDMGFTHIVANNESRHIIAAFASEADAVAFSDKINK